jgi:predicted CoA-binding protein
MGKSIAVIGASADRAKFGNKCVRAFLEEGYRVHPVNLAESVIEGRPVHRSVLDIPGPVDLASFYLRPEIGLRVIEEVARKGIPEVFLNPGAESPELIRRAKELGIRVRPECSIVAIGRSPSQYP